MIKEKPCKGQNKAHGADACGKMTDVRLRKYGLCPSCYWNWMQVNESGKVHYQKQFLKQVESKIKKTKTKKKKEEYESLKSIQRLIQDARRPFQKFIRIRDANDGCISCGDTKAKIWHAGHYFKAEIYSGLIFHETNVNKQCEKCNTYGGGNESGYRMGLVEKYSLESVRSLESIANQNRIYKFTREELIDIKKKYQKKIKEMLKINSNPI